MLRIQEIPADSIRRGIGLSLLLMFYILAGSLLVISGLTSTIVPMSNLAEYSPWVLNIMGIPTGAFDVLCGVAAWKWKKWGIWGLGANIVLGFFISFSLNTSADLPLFLLPMIQIGLLVYFAGPRWQLFE